MKTFNTLFFIIAITISHTLNAQVAVTTDGSSPDASAMLDVKSKDKGVLAPRMTSTQRIAISNPATGLLVFDETTGGFWFYNGSVWTSVPPTYSVGDYAQGGIIFWVDETGQHGLVCAKLDQSSNVRWYAGTNGYTQASGDGPFAGEMNTSIIISAHVAIGDDNSPYAARICNKLQITEGGKTYGNWYLPSKEELNLMYQNRAIINTTATAIGGSSFADDTYWSSTELNNAVAYVQDLSNGNQFFETKNLKFSVRAVRAF